MADIFHSLIINRPIERVFDKISTPNGLDKWWSKKCSGKAKYGEVYDINFGFDFNWSAKVTKFIENEKFELTMTNATEDWMNSIIGFSLIHKNETTELNFYHKGWPNKNDHYRISCYCWAMYLRILKRYLEYGEEVPYEKRLEV